MKVVTAIFTIPREEYQYSILNVDNFKESIHRELTYKLADRIMDTTKTPSPRSDSRGIMEYELRIGVLTEEQIPIVVNQLKELELWRTMFKHNQYIIDRTITEECINALLEK